MSRLDHFTHQAEQRHLYRGSYMTWRRMLVGQSRIRSRPTLAPMLQDHFQSLKWRLEHQGYLDRLQSLQLYSFFQSLAFPQWSMYGSIASQQQRGKSLGQGYYGQHRSLERSNPLGELYPLDARIGCNRLMSRLGQIQFEHSWWYQELARHWRG